MRKHTVAVLVALAMVGLPAGASAQGIGLGVKAGASLATLSIEGVEDGLSNKAGFTIGGFVNVGLSPMFSIQPELLFSQKGTSMSGEVLGETVEVDQKSSYIEVPVLARLSLGAPGVPVRPVVFAGPSFGFLLSAKAESGDAEEDIKENMKSLDVGGVIGAGVELGNFTIDGRYTLGLTNINDAEGDDEGSIKNRAIMITVGLKLPFGM